MAFRTRLALGRCCVPVDLRIAGTTDVGSLDDYGQHTTAGSRLSPIFDGFSPADDDGYDVLRRCISNMFVISFAMGHLAHLMTIPFEEAYFRARPGMVDIVFEGRICAQGGAILPDPVWVPSIAFFPSQGTPVHGGNPGPANPRFGTCSLSQSMDYHVGTSSSFYARKSVFPGVSAINELHPISNRETPCPDTATTDHPLLNARDNVGMVARAEIVCRALRSRVKNGFDRARPFPRGHKIGKPRRSAKVDASPSS